MGVRSSCTSCLQFFWTQFFPLQPSEKTEIKEVVEIDETPPPLNIVIHIKPVSPRLVHENSSTCLTTLVQKSETVGCNNVSLVKEQNDSQLPVEDDVTETLSVTSWDEIDLEEEIEAEEVDQLP